MNRYITLLAFIGATSLYAVVPDTAELGPNYYSEKVTIWISKASANRLGQVDVLGYFPNAALFFGKHLKPRSPSTKVSPAHLTLDVSKLLLEDSFDSTMKLAFSGSYEKIIWRIDTAKLVDFFKKNGFIDDSKDYFPCRLGTAADFSQLDITLADANQETYFFLLPRESQQAEANTIKYSFPASEESILVSLARGTAAENLTSHFAKALSPEDTVRLGTDVENKANPDKTLASAWKEARTLFQQHYYDRSWLETRAKYLGPKEPDQRERVLGQFVALINWPFQVGVLVVPTLVPPDSRRADQRVIPPVRINNIYGDRKNDPAKGSITKIDIDGESFLKAVLAPSLLKGKEDVPLKCALNSLTQNADELETPSICRVVDGKTVISVSDAQETEQPQKFIVTDENEIQLWEITLQMRRNGSLERPVQADFYPVRFNEPKRDR